LRLGDLDVAGIVCPAADGVEIDVAAGFEGVVGFDGKDVVVGVEMIGAGEAVVGMVVVGASEAVLEPPKRRISS